MRAVPEAPRVTGDQQQWLEPAFARTVSPLDRISGLLQSLICLFQPAQFKHLIARHRSSAAASPLRRVHCFSSAKPSCLQLDKAADREAASCQISTHPIHPSPSTVLIALMHHAV